MVNDTGVYRPNQVGPLTIGSGGADGTRHHFAGDIDEVTVHNTALSDTDIQELRDTTRTCADAPVPTPTPGVPGVPAPVGLQRLSEPVDSTMLSPLFSSVVTTGATLRSMSTVPSLRASYLMVVGVIGAIVLLRIQPDLASDPGVFLTMFDGVLDGERLYVDRWDHKDPGFYWLGALGFGLFGIYGPAFLDGVLLVLIGLGAFRLAERCDCSRLSAVAIAIGAAGFVTNPAFHAPGLSEPPAVALLIWSYVFATQHRRVLALSLIGVLSFMKLAFLPIALPIVWMLRPHNGRDVAVSGLALGAPLALATTILAVRGEFGGWIESIQLNREYANSSPRWFGTRNEGILGHLEHLLTTIGNSPSLLLSVVLVAVTSTIARSSRRAIMHKRETQLAVGVFVALMAATFATAHMLRAGTLALVLLWIAVDRSIAARWSPTAAVCVVSVMAIVASGPHPTDIEAVGAIRDRWVHGETTFANDLQGELDRLQPDGPIDLAVSIGSPREAAIPFLSDRVRLACPDHHLLPWFESRFEAHLDCIAESASHVVVGPLSFPSSAEMQAYERSLNSVLETHFVLVGTASGDNQGDVQIFARP